MNMFSSNELDLLLLFDAEHFKNNAGVIDQLHSGDVIEFSGFITRLLAKSKLNENRVSQM